MCVIAAGILMGWDQPAASADVTVTNWGSPACGARLGIATTNTTHGAGSEIRVEIWITNGSPNAIAVSATGDTRYDFDVSLLDTYGTNHYPLPSTPRMVNGNIPATIMPNQAMKTYLLLGLDARLQAGAYSLQLAKGLIYYSGEKPTRCRETVKSNILPLKIE